MKTNFGPEETEDDIRRTNDEIKNKKVTAMSNLKAQMEVSTQDTLSVSH